jgi:acetyl-CoA carboxylase biotin carboxylase subunit
VHGKNRNEAIHKLKSALNEYVIEGVKTTIPLHKRILNDVDFTKGEYDIRWLEKLLKKNG